MDVFVNTQNGFELAEEDLKIRGPGEFFGTRQHGIPEFKIVDLIHDAKIIPLARKEAFNIFQDGIFDKGDHIKLIEEEIMKRYGKKMEVN